jgi:hypothetical protein
MGDERPVDTVRALRLPADVEAMVLAGNLAGLLGL